LRSSDRYRGGSRVRHDSRRSHRCCPEISPVDAASLVVAGTTALIALRDSTNLASGERVLVRGAAGGVGTAAVQLARAMGGHVTALARDRYAQSLADLGADCVLGYDAALDQTGSVSANPDTALLEDLAASTSSP